MEFEYDYKYNYLNQKAWCCCLSADRWVDE